jgi:diguanylate cyclase (GGDEF)-like protein
LDIGHNLVGELKPRDLYRTIHEETSKVLEAAGFYIALFDRESDLATVVFYADRGEERDVAISFPGSDSQVLRSGEGTIVPDGVESRSLMVLGDPNSEITRSAISVPLLYRGEVTGSISVQSYEPGVYSEADLELLQGIADLAAVSINNARHVAELEQRRREAERIEEIGRVITSSLDAKDVLRAVTEAVLELVGADASSVWLLEEGQARVAASAGEIRPPEGSTWPLPEAIREKIIDEGEPFLLSDLQSSPLVPEDVRSRIQAGTAVLVPLLHGDAVTGGLSVGKLSTGGISEEEVGILRRLASQASVALANAGLLADLQALSLTDPLTGLANRRHLDIHLEREVAAARRGRSVCIILFDLDDFKAHNDKLGHVVGDQILRRFGQILMGETRAMNLAARYGGDEFLSILTELPLDGALIHANRVDERVRNDPELSRYGVTVSFGVGVFDPGTMFGPEDLIQSADENLYACKMRRGRRPDAR